MPLPPSAAWNQKMITMLWSDARKLLLYDMHYAKFGTSLRRLFNYTGPEWMLVLLNTVNKEARAKLMFLFLENLAPK
jgi:hypothetical protein